MWCTWHCTCVHKQKKWHFHAKMTVHWQVTHGVGHILLCSIFRICGHWSGWGGWARGGHRIYCTINIIQEIEIEHTWAEEYWSTFVGLVILERSLIWMWFWTWMNKATLRLMIACEKLGKAQKWRWPRRWIRPQNENNIENLKNWERPHKRRQPKQAHIVQSDVGQTNLYKSIQDLLGKYRTTYIGPYKTTGLQKTKHDNIGL